MGFATPYRDDIMGQDRTFRVSAINIVTHPHSPNGYVDLLRRAMALRRPVAIRGTQHIMFGELRHVSRGEPEAGLFGRVYRFDHIASDLPWFNVATHEEATDEEMAGIAIPENLVPNLVLFDFVFFPKGHTLYFVSHRDKYPLSPRSLAKLLNVVFSTQEIFERFGKVDVTIIPDRQTLRRIFQIHRLAKLTIDVKRPNPDDNEADDEVVFGRLERQGTRRIVQEMTAEPGESIKPDEDTKVLAKVAVRNGKVHAVGYTNDGVRIEESTVDVPWRETVDYDPNYQTAADALVAYARTALNDR